MQTNERAGAAPYPGRLLRRGSTGNDVKTLQYYLDMVREYTYDSLGFLRVDGIFGSGTESTVRQYQTLKGLAADGIVGPATWRALAADYNAIPDTATEVYPGAPLTRGSTGVAVVTMQTKLAALAPTYTALNTPAIDGIFGQDTANATRLFQKQFGLAGDEIIGENTWYAVINTALRAAAGNPVAVQTRYPGAVLRSGSSGDSVRFVQSYMNRVSTANGLGFPVVEVDGRFGAKTAQLVTAFQLHYGLNADGVVGSGTWTRMLSEYNNTL